MRVTGDGSMTLTGPALYQLSYSLATDRNRTGDKRKYLLSTTPQT